LARKGAHASSDRDTSRTDRALEIMRGMKLDMEANYWRKKLSSRTNADKKEKDFFKFCKSVGVKVSSPKEAASVSRVSERKGPRKSSKTSLDVKKSSKDTNAVLKGKVNDLKRPRDEKLKPVPISRMIDGAEARKAKRDANKKAKDSLTLKRMNRGPRKQKFKKRDFSNITDKEQRKKREAGYERVKERRARATALRGTEYSPLRVSPHEGSKMTKAGAARMEWHGSGYGLGKQRLLQMEWTREEARKYKEAKPKDKVMPLYEIGRAAASGRRLNEFAMGKIRKGNRMMAQMIDDLDRLGIRADKGDVSLEKDKHGMYIAVKTNKSEWKEGQRHEVVEIPGGGDGDKRSKLVRTNVPKLETTTTTTKVRTLKGGRSVGEVYTPYIGKSVWTKTTMLNKPVAKRGEMSAQDALGVLDSLISALTPAKAETVSRNGKSFTTRIGRQMYDKIADMAKDTVQEAVIGKEYGYVLSPVTVEYRRRIMKYGVVTSTVQRGKRYDVHTVPARREGDTFPIIGSNRKVIPAVSTVDHPLLWTGTLLNSIEAHVNYDERTVIYGIFKAGGRRHPVTGDAMYKIAGYIFNKYNFLGHPIVRKKILDRTIEIMVNGLNTIIRGGVEVSSKPLSVGARADDNDFVSEFSKHKQDIPKDREEG